MVYRRYWSVVALLLFIAGLPWEALGNDIYIDPSGSNDRQTFLDAISAASPGDTIFVHGGTYDFSQTLQITKSGISANPINMVAVPGETPVLNFSAQSLGGRGIELKSTADWWYIKGLTIEYAGDNGFYSEGEYGVYEQIVTRYNRDSGFQLHSVASNNLVLNCDSYENFDPNNHGENADGFALKSADVGPGNIFRGNRAWGNSDDGFDVYYTVNYGILVDNCWTFDNGKNFLNDPVFQGDGNGFKLGNPGGPSVVVNSLAVDNPHNGMDINGSTAAVKVFNSTSFSNARNWRFDEPESAQILQNNISYQGSSSDSIDPAVSDSFNSWNGGVTLNSADFQSLARFVDSVDLLKAPRQADGSLPDLGGFLKLAEGSDLIDAGTPISFVFNGVTYNLPYNGLAPDQGAYEFVAASAGLMGDYNDDDVIDAADYTAWRDAMTGGGSLTNDPTPGTVDESDFIYWRNHFGETLGSGAGAGNAAVPEPASFVLSILALCMSLCIRSQRRR